MKNKLNNLYGMVSNDWSKEEILNEIDRIISSIPDENLEPIGITDCNNIEICKGHIVKAINMSHNKDIPDEWTGEVKYGRNNCCWGIVKRVDVGIKQDGSVYQEQNIPIFNFINFHCGIVPDMAFEVIGHVDETT